MNRLLLAAAAAAATLAVHPTLAAEEAPADPPQVEWIPGPQAVDLGKEIAAIDLPESLAFAGAADTRKLLEMMGNVPQGSELGLVVPKAEDQEWFIIFRFDDVGYVKDDDADEIDADAILESIKEGTQAANEERKKRGMATIDVVGWAEPPRYDAATHNVTWAILGRNEDGSEVVNYNVRVLGRTGVMEVKLVDGAATYAAAKPEVDKLLAAFSYKAGKKYAEWVPGDKVAQYGLAALVAAGAGAAAVKTGFLAGILKILAKAGKAVILVAFAALAGIWKFVQGIFGRRAAPAPQPRFDEPPAPPPPPDSQA